MSFLRLVITISCVLSLSACQSVVRTDIETFRDTQLNTAKGTIRVTGLDPDQSKSLEFRHFKQKLETRLAQIGYTPVDDGETFLATLSYSVSRQEKDQPHSRVFVGGHIGGYTHRGSIIVTDNNSTEFEYVRELALTIDDTASEEPVKIVQVKATSVGKCEHLTVVYDEMLDAIFSNLMREDGSVERVKSSGDIRCP